MLHDSARRARPVKTVRGRIVLLAALSTLGWASAWAQAPAPAQETAPAPAAPATPAPAAAPAPAPAPVAPAPTPAPGLRLDTWTKNFSTNEEAPGWAARKFSPLVGSGDKYFYAFVHKSADEHYLHVATGKNNSFTVGTEKAYSLKEWPVVEWDWKMGILPKGGDIRVKEKDDQAGSFCIVLDPGLNFDSSLCYIFENEAPKEQIFTGTRRSNAKYMVIRTAKSGDPVGEWLHEKRNVYEDYKKIFGREPAKPANYGVQIDSNDTESSAEAFYRNIVLRKP